MVEASAADEQVIESILGVLHARTGADFRRYRTGTVQRRILNRIISVGAPSFPAYLALLESSPDEAARLLDRMAIKVSRFYRNRASFDLLRGGALRELGAGGRGLRLWSAGCGCGEEPYSLAMLLHEAGLAGEVVATDIDPAAIEAAAAALYPAEAAAELPAELAARYLATINAHRGPLLAVRPPPRALVRLARHDLLSGQPAVAGCDLVSCRNVLIYLQGAAREEVLRTIVRALRPGGYLLLGEAEWPSDDTAGCLEVVEHKARLFRRTASRP